MLLLQRKTVTTFCTWVNSSNSWIHNNILWNMRIKPPYVKNTCRNELHNFRIGLGCCVLATFRLGFVCKSNRCETFKCHLYIYREHRQLQIHPVRSWHHNAVPVRIIYIDEQKGTILPEIYCMVWRIVEHELYTCTLPLCTLEGILFYWH